MEDYHQIQPNTKNYRSREEEIRTELSKSEVIRRIEQIYHAQYDPDLESFDAWNQLLACETVVEATPVKNDYQQETDITKKNVCVIGNGYDSSKQNANFELTSDKLQVIAKLNVCHYRTPPKELAQLLENLFGRWEAKPYWWLYIAQHWTPKSIQSALSQMIKVHQNGQVTILNPAKYFSNQIQYHPKRKVFRDINDTHKRQDKISDYKNQRSWNSGLL